jgi:type IV secretory pathway VirB2 component (pilin)
MIKKAFFIVFFCLFFSANGAVDLNDNEPSGQVNQANNTPQPQELDAKNSQGQATTNKRLKLAENNPIAALLCKMIRAFTGTIAKIIAVLMIIGLGVNLFSANAINPVSPVTIVSVILGVGMLFSADYVVGKIMGDAGMGGTSSSCDCKYGITCNKI